MRRTARLNAHHVPTCAPTGLARYRDRRQARDAADALRKGLGRHEKRVTFACPECRGFHLDTIRLPRSAHASTLSAHGEVVPRRYVLVDLENLTGGRSTRGEARQLWETFLTEVGISNADRVVVGANRYTARKLSPVIDCEDLRWVVGAMGPDGADRALLAAAANLIHIAKHYDELVIASGDHAFADLARRARARNMRVQVVSRNRDHRTTLSADLRRTADTILTLPTLNARPCPSSPHSAA